MIGPIGRLARGVVGLAALAAAFSGDPSWIELAVGLVAIPVAVSGALAIRAARSPDRISATGPVGHLALLAIGLPLLFVEATATTALMFLGFSMLVAAAFRNGGCEVTAIPNFVLRRDDQVGCVLFGPVDAAERQVRGTAV